MKVLLVFWGIVLGSMALKFLSSYTPNKIDFSLSDYIDTQAIVEMLHLKRPEKTESNQTKIKTESHL